jgi:hypothetical protein
MGGGLNRVKADIRRKVATSVFDPKRPLEI